MFWKCSNMGSGPDSGCVLLVANADGCSTMQARAAPGGGAPWKHVGLSKKCAGIAADIAPCVAPQDFILNQRSGSRWAPSLRIWLQGHLHENIGAAIGHWRRSFRSYMVKADRFVQVNSILEPCIAAEKQDLAPMLLAWAIACLGRCYEQYCSI